MKQETIPIEEKIEQLIKQLDIITSKYKIEYKNIDNNCYKIKIINQSKTKYYYLLTITLILYFTLYLLNLIGILFHLLFLFILFNMIYSKYQRIEYESVTIFSQLGIQLTTKRTSKTTLFIPIENIQQIYILEGFTKFQVKFYLAILTNQNNNELVPIFRNLLPESTILIIVLKIARCLLLNDKL
ncbi:hypothetical protein K502DRAFT_174507 [Neoconidiobolus thromboides FSU 785]|nr:hypothetical protein K502DRAFT_174507 [Neoconidiobolus thromboides FSU 785]